MENDTLFCIYTNRGSFSPRNRAKSISEIITRLGKRYDIQPDSVSILPDEFTTDIVYGEKVILSLTDKDGRQMNMSREELAEYNRNVIVNTLKEMKSKHSLSGLVKQILSFTLILLLQYALICLTNWAYRQSKRKIYLIKNKYFKPISIKSYELFSIDKEEKMALVFLNMFRYFLITIQLIITIPILFSVFPQTESLAMQIFSYILTPAKKIGMNIIRYIPNLFVIGVICVIINYIIKIIGFLAKEIEVGRLKLPGFYSDWAKPTFAIIRFLLYAFTIVLIYPYLPNSDSKIFQGLSIFVGLIVSIGSSSALGNLIAGLIITYMRPFRLGDRIKIQDIVGDVVEKTPIVTRIKTLKNEIVTIPNAHIMNSQTTNLSESAEMGGLILHLDVTCGYNIPWRRVHQLLIDAAEDMPDILREPHPFVLEQSFNDFYVTYQINVYINDAKKLLQISTCLRQNIQDQFKEAGISILSPHYFFMGEMKQ